ncbi:MAG: AAA family ATPase [Bryobacterales bacterium]|nr:AAA family ATPase [Bryobacterales bacterium]
MGFVGSSSRLPIGVQTFSEIRKNNLYYVDKTPFALKLAQEGKHYFLSRPRRFGKSLFLTTLMELFQGSRDLFEGLAAHDRWDWSMRRPVVRLSFGAGNFHTLDGAHNTVSRQLRSYERRAGIKLCATDGPNRFAELLEELHVRNGCRVAVFVDEYDKPISDALREPDLARANRDYLRSLYATIKDCDEHVCFSFLTGVTKLSKVSLFSGLNNLRDITLNPAYSSICGYTESDLDTVFAPELEGLDRDRVREWYSGYSWGGNERVYNPFDVLLLLTDREFKPWWFETGTPQLLVDTLVERGVTAADLGRMHADDQLLSAFEIGAVSTQALLFQTGYLTLTGCVRDKDGERSYRLGYPNRSVRTSLNRHLLTALVPAMAERIPLWGRRFKGHLASADFVGLEQDLRIFLASIPHDWHRRNKIGSYEGYYATVVLSLFAGLGLDVRAEESIGSGRLDLVLRIRGRILLFEFKILERSGPGAALAQLKARGYAAKFLGEGKPVHLVGVEFSAESRSVTRIASEQA